MATKLEFGVELKSSAQKIWDSLIHEFITLFPKAFPHVYESIEALEGDGMSGGSVRFMKFAPEFSAFSSVTEKVLSVDEEKKIMCYTLIDGEIVKYLKNFKSTFCVISKDEGSLVKLSVEFDNGSEEINGEDLYKDFVTSILQELDAYLLKAASQFTLVDIYVGVCKVPKFSNSHAL